MLNGSTYQPAPASFIEGATDGKYNYNSCRTPWRFATDYLLGGTSGSLAEARKMNSERKELCDSGGIRAWRHEQICGHQPCDPRAWSRGISHKFRR